MSKLKNIVDFKPQLFGPEILAELRKNPDLKNLSVMFMTAKV